MGNQLLTDKQKKLNRQYKRMMTRRVSLIICALYLVITLLFILQIINFDILSSKFLIPLVFVLILIALGFYRLQLGKRTRRAVRNISRGLIVILGVVLGLGNFYLFKTSAGLNRIAHGKNVTTISVVMLKDAKEDNSKDLKKATFGRAESGSQTYITKALANIESELGIQVEPKAYSSLQELSEDLYNEEIDAVILNESMRSMFTDVSAEFTDQTEVVWTKDYEQEVEETEKAVAVTKEPFNVYISGIDTYGTVDTSGHTDVNMIVSVNPETHQVLMISIPRDYYIPQTSQGGLEDKLTHSGVWGVESTVKTVENFFDVDLNYYLKVNFSGVTNILTAIGDIQVDNPIEFTGGEGNYHFTVGKLKLDAEQALSYARERQSFAASDEIRIQNQSRVLEGVIKKVTSPAILANYAGLVEALSTSFQTNMSRKEMNALVKMQIDSMPEWSILQISAAGSILEGAYSPAGGTTASVVLPDDDSVRNVKKIMQMVHQGQDIAAAVDAYKNNNQVSDEVLDPYFYKDRDDLGELSDVPEAE